MKKVILTVLMALSVFTSSNARNWDKVIKAIAVVESNNQTTAKNGHCVGVLQIMPILVKQCNKISNKHYTMDDRLNRDKSIEMFNIIQDYYNSEGNIEKAVRIWNGGPHYKKSSTSKYTKKVLAEYYK